MKYTILIDQRVIAERFPELNLKDAALLAFLGDAFNSPHLKRFTTPEGDTFTWLKSSWIIEQMPLLGATTNSGMQKRMQILREAELIESKLIEGRWMCHRPGRRWNEITGIEAGDMVGFHLPAPKSAGVGETRPPPQKGDTSPPESRHLPPKSAGAVYKGLDHEDEPMKTNPPTPQGGTLPADFLKKPAKAPKPSKAKSRDHESAHHYPESWQQDVPFTNALADYFRQRREKRQPATPTAAELLRKKLLAAGIETATIALVTSATNGWTGVFPEKTTHPTKEKPGADEPGLALW